MWPNTMQMHRLCGPMLQNVSLKIDFPLTSRGNDQGFNEGLGFGRLQLRRRCPFPSQALSAAPSAASRRCRACARRRPRFSAPRRGRRLRGVCVGSLASSGFLRFLIVVQLFLVFPCSPLDVSRRAVPESGLENRIGAFPSHFVEYNGDVIEVTEQ